MDNRPLPLLAKPQPRPAPPADSGAQCIWSQAGVVPVRRCPRDYACPECPFERALQRAVARNRRRAARGATARRPVERLVHWKEMLLRGPVGQRPCVHHMRGRTPFRTCQLAYQCHRCEFDQCFQDRYRVHAVLQPVARMRVDGFILPQGVYLHTGHMWCRIEDGAQVRLGVDDFALRLFAPLEDLQLPLLGTRVGPGRRCAGFGRPPLDAILRAPVGGVVSDVNPRLPSTAGEWVRSAYGGAWLVRLQADRLRRDLRRLMIGSEAAAFLRAESGGLQRFLADTGHLQAADGGDLVPGFAHLLGAEYRGRLLRRFLGDRWADSRGRRAEDGGWARINFE